MESELAFKKLGPRLFIFGASILVADNLVEFYKSIYCLPKSTSFLIFHLMVLLSVMLGSLIFVIKRGDRIEYLFYGRELTAGKEVKNDT